MCLALILVKPSRLWIALPASAVWSAQHLREKTVRVANLLRAVTTFRVPRLVLLDDVGSRASTEITQLIDYLNTPPYLKKYVPLTPVLRFAGAAPPIKGPLHTVSDSVEEALKEPFRMAQVTVATHNRVEADTGLAPRIRFNSVREHAPREKILVKISRTKSGELTAFETSGQGYFTFPKVDTFALSNKSWLPKDAFKVELSRKGLPLPEISVPSGDNPVILFVGRQRDDPSEFLDLEFDARVNLVPDQGVETVRADEAYALGFEGFIWKTEANPSSHHMG